MKLATMILFLIPVVVARHNHRTVLESILKSRDNLYAKTEREVQNAMNNLFNYLNIAPSFLARTRIKLLLTMHYDLNSMAEKNYDVFEKLVEAARPDNGNGTLKGLALFKLIENTLNEESSKLSVKENKTSHEPPINKNTHCAESSIETSSENISPSEPVFADSKEFRKFIKDFMNKVNKLDETDFSKSTPLLSPIEEDATLPFNEVWEPPEFDLFNDTRRIFKGKRSRSRTYPFVVSVHLMDTFVCAGSIVSNDLILTAASCLQILHNNRFFRENPRAVFVRIGSDYFSRRGEMVPILEAFFHPSYNPKTLANNLVLLRLMRQINFKRKEGRVRRILYDRTTEHLSGNTDGVIIVGWGSRKQNNIIDQFERMMAARLDVYQFDECVQIYSREYVTRKHFCAGFVATGGGACNKDLGGPGIVGGLLVGVVSFGAPLCGAVDAPTVFTKLGFYSKWIDSIIEQERPSILGRTTIADGKVNRYFRDPLASPPAHPFRTTRGYIEPPLMFPEKSEEEEYKNVVKRRSSSRSLFDQLFPNTPTTRYPIMLPIQLLRNMLYNDYGQASEEVNDMFKTSTKLHDVNENPLANLSLWPLPGYHEVSSRKVRHSTIHLTTSRYDKDLTPGTPTASVYYPTMSYALKTTSTERVDHHEPTEATVTETPEGWFTTPPPKPATKKEPTITRTTEKLPAIKTTGKLTVTVTTENLSATKTTEKLSAAKTTTEPAYEYYYYSEEVKNKTLRFQDFLYMS